MDVWFFDDTTSIHNIPITKPTYLELALANLGYVVLSCLECCYPNSLLSIH